MLSSVCLLIPYKFYIVDYNCGYYWLFINAYNRVVIILKFSLSLTYPW